MNNKSFRVALASMLMLFIFHQSHMASAATESTTPGSGINQQMVYVDNQCSLMEWNAGSGKSHLLYKREDCPQRLFIQSGGNTAFLVYGNTLIVLDLTNPASKVTAFDLPTPKIPKDVSKDSEVVTFVQYTKISALAIELTYFYPWDSEEDYLYERIDDSWVLANEITCGRFGGCVAAGGKEKSNTINLDDGFASYNGIPYKLYTALYNLPDAHNPYVKSITSRNVVENEDDAGYIWTAKFKFGVHTSILNFKIIDGPDSGLPSLFGISMVTDNGKNIIFSNRQCDASLLGRYLIVYGYQNMHTALIDLASGKALLTNMQMALWRQ
ncbi:MAG: hypothetical protein ACYDCJ_04515 [Gammaproteobacteria bacterium]